VRLYGFASALTVLAAGGVVAGAAVWDECSSSSWFCINPGPLVMFASAIVGVHGLILFAIAAGVNAKAARRDRRLQDDLQARIGLDVRVSPNEAGLVLNGSF